MIDHLSLVGSPIDGDFQADLRRHPNIRKVIVMDLQDRGDPIYAGMTQVDLIAAAPTLGKQMLAGKGEWHFYYAHLVRDSPSRWATLAQAIAREGAR